MAEYDKGRFYWIKLTDKFISSDTVDFLMSQKDGANYVVLYQMLCLKTVNNGGVLARQLGETIIPYEIDKIQRDCKWFSIDTVRIALELYKKLGLIYENNDGMLAISNFNRLIGSQTYGAEKKELQKQNRESNLLQGGTKVEKIPPEIDTDKEIYIDIEKKEIHKEKKPQQTRFVKPTLEEVGAYCKERNNSVDIQRWFDYYESNGWKVGKNPMKDWKASIRTWERGNNEKNAKPKYKCSFDYDAIID